MRKNVICIFEKRVASEDCEYNARNKFATGELATNAIGRSCTRMV